MLSDGTPLVRGKTMTGFANSEEDFADSFVGKKVTPFRIEDEAKKLGANFITGGRFKRFATRDGRLITGQQPYTKHGVFSHVDIRAWTRVLPKAQEGALKAALILPTPRGESPPSPPLPGSRPRVFRRRPANEI